mmetsp:Transcript_8704/g.24308  ORF Transcript_8704/g.24308 Transcript_8704/m.24308 type:complete len:238 (-) Transcript_8704:315-1028(-)
MAWLFSDPEIGTISFVLNVVAGVADVVRRVLLIFVDLWLVLCALVAFYRDFGYHCDQTLRVYCVLCIGLCTVDLVMETMRCSTERALDRLQDDLRSDVGQAQHSELSAGLTEGLGRSVGDAPRGSAVASMSQSANNPLGTGIRRLKAAKQKRTAEMHFWSLVFTTFVAVVFAIFSTQDEDCSINVPHLVGYLHVFTYIFILRLGALLLAVCCRTIKNYEDAASINMAHSAGSKSLHL